MIFSTYFLSTFDQGVESVDNNIAINAVFVLPAMHRGMNKLCRLLLLMFSLPITAFID